MPRTPGLGDEIGKNFGKYDIDRVGLFSEMAYMINDKYKPLNHTAGGTRDLKKSQMYPGILKTKTGLQDAYFDPKYKRLFENEKLYPIKKPKKTNNTTIPAFLPSSYTKRHSTPGDTYGTFGPNYTAMSNVKRPRPKLEKLLPNMSTIPTNTSGPGWTDRGMSRFPEYMPSPYGGRTKKKPNNDNKKNNTSGPFLNAVRSGDYFEKNPYFTSDIKRPYKIIAKEKFKGAPFLPSSKINNIGKGFDRWPIHVVDPYRPKGKKNKDNATANKIFYPQTRNKSFYTVSTIQRKLRCAQNHTNWEKFVPITYINKSMA